MTRGSTQQIEAPDQFLIRIVMTGMNLDNLSFCRFKAIFDVSDTLQLPAYTGNIIHGVLGRAMRSVRYGNKDACSTCPIRSECRYSNLYAYLFESPFDHPFIKENARNLSYKQNTYPQPFTFYPPAGGYYLEDEELEISFTLIGGAISSIPFMICALEMLGMNGLGKDKVRMFLKRIICEEAVKGGNGSVIYDSDREEIHLPVARQILDFERIREITIRFLPSHEFVEKIRIRFLTPFRYKHKERLGRRLTFEIFVRGLLRRITLLSVYSPLSFAIDHSKLLSSAKDVRVIEDNLDWFEFERYSSKQKVSMAMGGFLGTITFFGNMNVFLPYIKVGEFINVGKNVSFGLGKYRITFL